jgi:predicted CXXCH cytochrome family protein
MATYRRSSTSKPKWNWVFIVPALAVAGGAFAVGGGLFAAQLENHDAFCASCHTQPESAYYQRTQDQAAVDLASAHAAKKVGCIQCHSGPGVTGRVGAMMVGAGDLTAYLSGHYRNPAIVTVPVGDAYCLKCHAAVTTNRSFNNHFHLFLSQWQRGDPKNAATCVECHQAHLTGGPANVAFLQEATTIPVCERCHAFAGR